MLTDWSPRGVTSYDEQVFDLCVRPDHFLRRALETIDWEQFHEKLARYYSPNLGRPAEPPVLMLKLEYLRYQYGLSDNQVIVRAETDMAFRCFLRIGVGDSLPDRSLLCRFRGRLGVDGFRTAFHELVSQARAAGLVKDRLRIKDATHVIANIAVPNTLALISQIRDKLLKAAEPFDPVRTEGEKANILLLREAYTSRDLEERLVARTTHLREILAWVDELPPPGDSEKNPQWAKLVEVRSLAHKILADQDNPEAGDRTISAIDPDARRGKHGQWYDGYLVDILVDADSELITSVNVLPANGDEAADAIELVQQEEAAHGNDIEQLSIDGVGFQGPVLRELQDAAGLDLEVFVPPTKQVQTTTGFAAESFHENPEQGSLTCPAGQITTNRSRNRRDTAWVYQFAASTCCNCSLRNRCLANSAAKSRRHVSVNDYQFEYDQARAKAGTAAYEAVRREHPKVERRLADMANRHSARRAQVRGHPKVLCQQLMAASTANIKRMVRLLSMPNAALATL